MASIPIDQTEDNSTGSGKPPVSAHPAFPAIVALWFAALLGIGTLIVPVQLIEQLVTMTGISSLISSAAPPLGFTARAAIALAATILGAGLGLVAARRLVARGTSSFASGRKDKGMRALNPADDLDDDFLSDDLPPLRETSAPLGRRRPLAIAEDEARSDFLDIAPLPGESDGYETDEDALELSDQYHSADDHSDAAEEYQDESQVQDFASDSPASQEIMPAGTIPQSIDELIAEEADEAEAEAPLEIGSLASAPFAQGSVSGQPLPFSPPSLARQAETAPTPAALEDDSMEQAELPEPDEETTDEVSVPDTSNFEDGNFQDGDFSHGDSVNDETPAAFADSSAVSEDQEGSANEDSVGLVQLVQKLGSTLEKHREWSAQRAVEAELEAQATAEADAKAAEAAAHAEDLSAEETAAEEPAAGDIAPEFDPAAPDDAAEAMAAYFGKPAGAAQSDVAVEDETEVAADDAELEEDLPAPAPPAGSNYQPFAGMGRLAAVEDDEQDSEDEIHDIAASFSLPRLNTAEVDAAEETPLPRPSFDIPPANAPVRAPEAAVEDADAIAESDDQAVDADLEPAGDASYRSLAQIDNPFKRSSEEFVRVEEPEHEAGSDEPAVLFPNQQAHKPAGDSAEMPAASGPRAFDRPNGQPAPAPEAAPSAAPAAAEPRNPAAHEDNEQALRAALMNLQRMAK